MEIADDAATSSACQAPSECADCATLKSDFELERTRLEDEIADAKQAMEALQGTVNERMRLHSLTLYPD